MAPDPDLQLGIKNDDCGTIHPAILVQQILDLSLQLLAIGFLLTTAFAVEQDKSMIVEVQSAAEKHMRLS